MGELKQAVEESVTCELMSDEDKLYEKRFREFTVFKYKDRDFCVISGETFPLKASRKWKLRSVTKLTWNKK